MQAINAKDRADDAHQDLGIIAAKYLENLQRSNEQLVKITTLFKKQSGFNGSAGSLDEDDKENLYDHIQDQESVAPEVEEDEPDEN